MIKPMNLLPIKSKKYSKQLTGAGAGGGKESRNGGLPQK
jgi:hypothetical protein